MEKSINRYVKLYPWYSGFTGDLLFYIAIDSLFLTLVKNFTAAEIVSITSLSQLICIVLQFPMLFVIKKIGNTASVRSGATLLLLSALFITFGKSYYLVLFGRILHDVAIIFKTASVVALENNLEMVDRKGEFITCRTRANTTYAVITMLISFVASWMFNLNNYLPMYGCIATCTTGVVLSFFMKDASAYNKISRKNSGLPKVKLTFNKLVVVAIVLYALFYLSVSNGQNEGKLYIQDNFLKDFDKETTALIMGAMICVSRIIRVASNIAFDKLYKKYRDKIGVALPVMLATSIACILFGSFAPSVIVKIVVMAAGYTIILFVRDPFKLYMQDVLFDNTPKEHRQTILTILEFAVKATTAGIGLIFSAILLNHSLMVIMIIALVMTVIEVAMCFYLYRLVLLARKSKEA